METNPSTPSPAPEVVRLRWLQAVFEQLNRPIVPASLVAFRIAFGLLNLLAVIRFAAYGWIYELYIQPTYHFSWTGFEWVKPWPGVGMYLHFILLAVLSLFIAFGCYYRVSITLFCLAFTYVELLDKATYLNHYYFISLLSFLMIFMPLGRVCSVDEWRNSDQALTLLPAWPLWVIRLQVGLVYFFAGVAKLNSDWLLRAQPLKIWLYARSDFPLLGPLFARDETAYLMSYAGAFFDLTVFFFLLHLRTRLWAWLAVLFFHVLTWALFNIGMFPWIMIGCSLIFFEPDWPLRWMPAGWLPGVQKLGWHRLNTNGALPSPPREANPATEDARAWPTLHRPLSALLCVYFLLQFLLPLRHHLYPGNVCWTEQGFRFSWHVMLVEKSGQVDFTLIDPISGKEWRVNPRSALTSLQTKAFATQPDMILQLAHHLGRHWQSQGYAHIQVYAHARVAWNGRASQVLIDPTVDLMTVTDTFSHKSWIVSSIGS